MKTTLIDRFRRIIHDVRYGRRAMGLAVSGTTGTAIAEITGGHLIVTVTVPGVTGLDLDLSNPRYNTVDRLRQVLDRTDGYRCTVDEDVMGDHTTLDLEPFGPTPILDVGVDLKHHVFSDLELDEILTNAIRRHNPSMLTFGSLPEGEEPFVLTLAHSQVCKVLATDTVKRKGMDETVESLLAIAASLEDQYDRDIKRVAKALAPTKESNPSVMGNGDIVMGQLVRPSPRTGYRSPSSQALPPDPVASLDAGQLDVEDDNIRVTWLMNRSPNFYGQELFVGTDPEVIRPGRGNEGEYVRGNPARRAFYMTGPSGDAGANRGQGNTSHVVTGLEPETEYFFRLYVTDLNNQTVGSEVISARTKPLRVRFANPSWASAVQGPAGTQVTFYFNPKYGDFTEAHVLTMEGKVLVPVSFTADQATVVVPNFFQTNSQKTVVVKSPTGLIDVRKDGFTVTDL